MLENSKGERFYGMHFYPGVAEYSEPGKDSYRVFLNEDTIRKMDSSFEGKPVYVHHVDGVTQKLDDLRGEVDGWVVRSFYNAADGKHWCEFLVVSEKGLKAIRGGMRLSNAYFQKSAIEKKGQWNGVSYAKEITNGEYEHLAIVPNPRYEESVVMTPDQFKKYNEDKHLELSRLTNSHQEGESVMKLSIFKREKVENSVDLAATFVSLPKSKRELTIAQMAEELDYDGKAPIANASHLVKVGEETHSVSDLVALVAAQKEEIETLKNAKKNKEDDEECVENKEDEEDPMENEEDEDEKEKKAAMEAAKKEKKENAKEKNEALKNAAAKAKAAVDVPEIVLGHHAVTLGKQRYGSGS